MTQNQKREIVAIVVRGRKTITLDEVTRIATFLELNDIPDWIWLLVLIEDRHNVIITDLIEVL